jgi:3-oxoacyl-[acyl-carrier protein] reductase
MQGSSVIFIGSTLSEKAVANRASYVTTKHAVVGLMRSYVQDLFGSGVHTAVVCPGFTDTPMLQTAMTSDPEGSAKFIESFVSCGRLIQVGAYFNPWPFEILHASHLCD